MTRKRGRFQLLLTNEHLAVAYARLVQDRGQAYMVIDLCPLCGGEHIHAAERLYTADGRQGAGFAPSYTKRQAECDPRLRRRWMRLHPEVQDLDDCYVMMPYPQEAKLESA